MAIKNAHTTKNWDITEHKRDVFSSNDLINAYLKGIEEGGIQQRKALKRLLNENLDKAYDHTSQIIKELKKRNFGFHSALLKIHDWDEFEVLIIVPQEDFLDEGFLEIYNLLPKYEKDFEEDTYQINFSFVDFDKSLDESKVEADGFLLEYRNNQE